MNENARYVDFIDLASERLGGKVLSASDEFFAEKENLIKPGRGIFIADKYTDRGKWMDGWETRRRRTPGFDWAIIKLGCPGIIRGVDIDTNFFLGNHPPFAALEACEREEEWTEILPQSPLKPGSQNLFPTTTSSPAGGWTHVRLKIFPDGGVARLRVYGEVVKDWKNVGRGEVVDLAAVVNGGRAVEASDMFFSPMQNLIMPGKSLNMGDGWETRRRRGPGNDWVMIKLGAPGTVKKIEIDTAHFKGNFPESCSVEGCGALNEEWKEILPRTKLSADTVHTFDAEVKTIGKVSHVRLNIYPDGGIARFRVWGSL